MEVAGALIGYPLTEATTPEEIAEQPELIRPLMALEAEAPGHWYVNVVSVFPEFRGQGLGTLLLAEAERIGRPVAPEGLAIIVSAANTGAVRLYQRVGFTVTGRRPMVPYPGHETGGEWLLLTKPYS
jgi:ribosomal protein S18 acetylase RimI-like enzyme